MPNHNVINIFLLTFILFSMEMSYRKKGEKIEGGTYKFHILIIWYLLILVTVSERALIQSYLDLSNSISDFLQIKNITLLSIINWIVVINHIFIYGLLILLFKRNNIARKVFLFYLPILFLITLHRWMFLVNGSSPNLINPLWLSQITFAVFIILPFLVVIGFYKSPTAINTIFIQNEKNIKVKDKFPVLPLKNGLKILETIKSKDYEKTIELLKQNIKEKGKNNSLIYSQLGYYYKKLNEIDESIFYAEKAYSIDSNDYQTLQLLSTLYLKKDDYDSTYKYAKEGIEQFEKESKNLQLKTKKILFMILRILSIIPKFKESETKAKEFFKKYGDWVNNWYFWAMEYVIWYKYTHEKNQSS